MAGKNKISILTFAGFYLPGYRAGGALRSIANITSKLSDSFNFKIIALNRDFGCDVIYKDIKTNEWNLIGKEKVFYTDKKIPLKKIIESEYFDIYYLNSFFSYNFSIKVILLKYFRLIPQKLLILAPRGELGKGALKFKTFKKRFFILISKILKLHSNILWHASTKKEAEDIKKIFGENIKVKIALDIPEIELLKYDISLKKEKEKGKINILFLSVIHKGKNLSFVIDVLNKLNTVYSLDIYGPVKDKKYITKCEKLIKKYNLKNIRFMGIAEHKNLKDIYNNYDLLFFPTFSENFGHVIFESLALGTPVLTSKNVPWDDLEKSGAGWNFDLSDFKKFVDVIERLAGMGEEEFYSFRSNCRKYLDSKINIGKILSDYKDLFESTLI